MQCCLWLGLFRTTELPFYALTYKRGRKKKLNLLGFCFIPDDTHHKQLITLLSYITEVIVLYKLSVSKACEVRVTILRRAQKAS